MKRADIKTMVRALRDLDRLEGHQPFAELVSDQFKNRPHPERRCPNCHGPLDGWMAAGGTQIIWCRFCTTFEEASARLTEVLGPPRKQPRTWHVEGRWFYVDWGIYDPGYDYRRVLSVEIGRRVVFQIGWRR